MENKKIKIKFGKEEKEFEIPPMKLDCDMQTSIDLMAIQAKAERRFKDLKPDKQYQDDDKKVMTLEFIQYRNFVASQFNLDTTFYVLNKIDETVTKEQVNGMGNAKIAEFVEVLFSREEEVDEDFQKATKKKQVASSPQKKT